MLCRPPDQFQNNIIMRHLVSVAIAAAASVVVVGGAAYYYLRKKIRGSVRSLKVDETPVRQGHLKLYHSFPFRSSRCAWLVNELHVEDYVEVVSVNIHGAEAKELMEYRDVHPHGTLPALELEDGKVILESSAICLYLAEAFLDSNGDSLLPEPQYLADYFNMICYSACTVDAILEPLYIQLTHTPEEKRNQSLIDTNMRKFSICCNVISTLLNDRLYVCGSKFTAADCVVGYNVWWASAIHNGELLKEFPVLVQYLERLKERPAFKECMKKKASEPSETTEASETAQSTESSR